MCASLPLWNYVTPGMTFSLFSTNWIYDINYINLSLRSITIAHAHFELLLESLEKTWRVSNKHDQLFFCGHLIFKFCVTKRCWNLYPPMCHGLSRSTYPFLFDTWHLNTKFIWKCMGGAVFLLACYIQQKIPLLDFSYKVCFFSMNELVLSFDDKRYVYLE